MRTEDGVFELISLVTGGAGFMGSHVAHHCQKRGDQVIILDDLSGGFRENLPDHVEFVEGSVCNHALIDQLFSKFRFDYVYHLLLMPPKVYRISSEDLITPII